MLILVLFLDLLALALVVMICEHMRVAPMT